MKTIPLKQGMTAFLDDQDYERVKNYTWRAFKSKKDTTWYVVAVVHGRMTLIHRLLMDPKPEQLIDHINGNGLDNRRSNLRFCTHGENMHNMRARWGNSIFKGVYWNKKARSWHARIQCNSKRISLGYHHEEASAARAYDKAAVEFFGEFANTNFGGHLNVRLQKNRMRPWLMDGRLLQPTRRVVSRKRSWVRR